VLRRIRSPSQPLVVLLFTWALSLCAPALHARFEIGDGDEASRGGSHDCEACRGPVVHHEGVVLHAGCDAGDDCRDPTHHHHPPFQHDATRCPACASSLERASELPFFRFTSPRITFVAAAASIRIATPAERHVCALARGPPSPDVSIVGACGIG
jgi:hypothetical protein